MSQDSIEQSERATVDVLSADDVITGPKELHDGIQASHATAKRETVTATLEGRDIPFKRLPSGVLSSRVLVPLVLPDPVLHVSGRLVNRRHDRAGRGVGALPRVNRTGGHATGKVFVVDARHGLKLVRSNEQGQSEANARAMHERAMARRDDGTSQFPTGGFSQGGPRDPKPAA